MGICQTRGIEPVLPFHQDQMHENSDPKLLKINLSDLHHIKTIGKGCFSTIWLVKFDKKYFALKIYEKLKIQQLRQSSNVLAEIDIHWNISYKHILNLSSVFYDTHHIFLMLPFVPGGDLFTLIHSKNDFKKEDIKGYAYQIVKIFIFLHSVPLIYRDLKPENILINYNGYLQLTDFGMARKLKTKEDLVFTFCGTPEYLSPEMLMHKGYGQKCDIWMIGMLIYEMFHNTTPFKGDTPTQLFKSILSDKPKISKRIDPNIQNLLKKLLIKDPVRRPTIYEVVDHKWFDQETRKQIDRFEWRPNFIPTLDDLGDCRYYDAFDNNLLNYKSADTSLEEVESLIKSLNSV